MCQYGYVAAADRFQPAFLALNGLDGLVQIGRTCDQRYSRVVHDSERYGLKQVLDLELQTPEAGHMH